MNCIIGADKTRCDLLEEFVGKTSSLNLVGTFNDSVSIRNQFLTQNDIELLFLDIEIPGLEGFDFINSLNYHPNIIIISTDVQNALKAFDFNVADYLLHPLTYSRFCKAVDKVTRYYSKKEVSYRGDKEIYIKKGSSLIRLKLKELIYIESAENHINVHTKDEMFTIHFTMKAMESQLAPEIFLRIHRSFIVNRNMIKSINDDSLDLAFGDTIKNLPIGKSFKEILLNKINRMSE